MQMFIVVVYVLKCFIIIASILGFLSARARVPALKNMLVQNSTANKKMWSLIILAPVVYILIGEVILYTPIPFNPTIPLIGIWILSIFLGTKHILGTVTQENMSVGKFTILYAIFTVLFTFAVTFIGKSILTRLMFGF